MVRLALAAHGVSRYHTSMPCLSPRFDSEPTHFRWTNCALLVRYNSSRCHSLALSLSLSLSRTDCNQGPAAKAVCAQRATNALCAVIVASAMSVIDVWHECSDCSHRTRCIFCIRRTRCQGSILRMSCNDCMHCNHGWRSLRAPHADTRRRKNKCSDAGNLETVSSLLHQKNVLKQVSMPMPPFQQLWCL